MKNLATIFFCVLLISLASCHKTDSNQKVTKTNPELEKFIGVWETSEFYYDSTWYNIADYGMAEDISVFERINLVKKITIRRDTKFPKDYIGDVLYNNQTADSEIKYLINTNDSISFTPNCEVCYFYDYKFKYQFISDTEVELTTDYIYRPIKMIKK